MAARAPQSRWLVIDTDVASAASDRPSPDPRPRLCRQFLFEVRGLCHRLAFPEALRVEWRNHHSTYSRRWLAEMHRRGKRKIEAPEILEGSLLQGLENRLGRLPGPTRVAVRKDLFLIEAALKADKLIVSLDVKARSAFARISLDFPPLQEICWISLETDNWQDWLRDGAPYRKDFSLQAFANRIEVRS